MEIVLCQQSDSNIGLKLQHPRLQRRHAWIFSFSLSLLLTLCVTESLQYSPTFSGTTLLPAGYRVPPLQSCSQQFTLYQHLSFKGLDWNLLLDTLGIGECDVAKCQWSKKPSISALALHVVSVSSCRYSIAKNTGPYKLKHHRTSGCVGKPY